MNNIISRPNGERVWGVIVCSTLAWIFSISATSQCSFMYRDVQRTTQPKVLVPLLHEGRGVGFWGWENSGSCYSYTIGGNDPSFDGAYKAAKAFTGFCDGVGGMAMVSAWMTSCFPAKKIHFRVLATVFVVVSFFEMLSLILMSSSLCKDGNFFSYGLNKELLKGEEVEDLLEGVTSSCSLVAGSTLAVVSSVFWLFSGIASRLVRPPKDDDGTIDMQTLEPLETPRGDNDRDSNSINDERDSINGDRVSINGDRESINGDGDSINDRDDDNEDRDDGDGWE